MWVAMAIVGHHRVSIVGGNRIVGGRQPWSSTLFTPFRGIQEAWTIAYRGNTSTSLL